MIMQNKFYRVMAGCMLSLLVAGLPRPALAQTLEEASEEIEQMAQQSNEQLSQVREEIREKQVPLVKKLSELEDELVKVRQEFQEVSRLSDMRNLDKSNLQQLIKSREEQNQYLGNLIDEYVREFNTNLQQSELTRYLEPIGEAENARSNEELGLREQFDRQINVLRLGLDRLQEASGGYSFPGKAVAEGGDLLEGDFVLFGPVSLFAAEDDSYAGITTQSGGANPGLVLMDDPELVAGIQRLAETGEGVAAVDVTLGGAIQMEATEETLLEHIKKGGPTMYPLLGLGALAVLTGLLKWIQLSLVSSISRRRFAEMMDHIVAGRIDEARAIADKVGGHVGKMLRAGIDHLNEPKELIEEVFYERILHSRTSLMRFLPFIAVTASAAPLLGLLGTVTGMINTFKLITVFGTGDAQSLSGGISEALVTTEWGLIVAIPNLLLFAFLSRKAKGISEEMDKLAIGFLNRIQEEEEEESGSDTDAKGGQSDDPHRKKIQASMVEEEKERDRPGDTPPGHRPDTMGGDTSEGGSAPAPA